MSNAMSMSTRIPARVNMVAEASKLERFEFIALFTAYATRTREGRSLVDGLQVRKTATGWTYGFNGGAAPLCSPCSARALFENIRAGALGEYVRQAEDFRAYVLS